MFHRQQVVARRHPGAAHVRDLGWSARAEERNEFAAQLILLLEAAVRVEIVAERAIARPGHVAAHRIDRFDVAAKTWRGAGVE